jgi:hypothetical protein
MRQLVLTNLVTGDVFRFPALPSAFEIRHGTTSTKIQLDALGGYTWPSGREPTEYHFGGKFWGPDRQSLPFIDPIAYRLPQDCIEVLETWHDSQYGNGTADGLPQRLRLVLTGADDVTDVAPAIKDVYISDFSSKIAGGMGDIEYDLTLTEWRALIVLRDTPGTPSIEAGAEGDQPQEGDPDVPPVPSSYTVKSGDTLSAIAQRFLGEAARWQEIYDLPENREVVGGDPDAISPGMQLTIPGGTPGAQEDDGSSPE